MLAAQYPGKLRVGYSPAQWQGSTQASTEVQRPNLKESICVPWNSQQQVKKKVDSYFYSLGQDSSDFVTPAYETSEKQSVYSNRYCMKGVRPKGFYMNIDTGQQRPNLDFTADCFVVTPSKNRHCSVPEHCPLLTALLKEAFPERSKMDFTRASPGGAKTMALNPGETRTHSLGYSGAMNFTPGQQQISPPLHARSSPENGILGPPTVEEIQNFVSEKIKEFRNKKNTSDAHTGSDMGGNDRRPNSNSAVNFLATSVSDKDTEWKVGQELQEDASDAAPTPKTKGKEYPQVTGQAAANCVRTGDKGLAALPSVMLDGLTLMYPSSSLNYSSLQEQHESHKDGINKTLAFKQMTDLGKGQKPAELVAVQGMPDVPGLQTKSSSLLSDEQNFLKDPQYDDISEGEDMTEHTTKHPLSWMQVEDISEDEIPRTGDVAGGPELFEHVKSGSASCDPSVLKDDDETDDDDDDWMVIPLSVSDIMFEPEDQEPEDEDGERPDEVVVIDDSDDDDDGESGDQEPQLNTCSSMHREPNPSAPPPSSQIEVFDTCESFLQAQRAIFNIPVLAVGCHTSASQNKDNTFILGDSTSDSEETEDSLDYSSDSSHNHLTISSKLLKNSSAMSDCSEKDDNNDEAVSEMVQQTTRSLKDLEDADVIIIDSDIEDEGDQICQKKTESIGISSDSDNSEDEQCSKPRRHLPAAQHHSTLHAALSGQSEQNVSENKEILISDSETEDESDKTCNRTNGWTPLSSGPEDDSDRLQKLHSPEKVDSKHGRGKSANSTIKAKTKAVRTSEQGQKPSRKPYSVSVDSEDETVNGLCDTAAQRKSTKQRPPSEDSQKNKTRSMDEDAECRTAPLIPVLHEGESPKPTEHLKLRACRVNLQANVRTSPPETLKRTTKKTDSGGKDAKGLPKPKPADHKQNSSKKEMQGHSKKAILIQRQHSLPNPERPSISSNSRSNINGHFSEAGPKLRSSRGKSQSEDPAAASHPPESMQQTSVPRHQASSSSFRRQLYQSHRSSSTSAQNYAPTNGLSALEKVTRDWQSGYNPIPPPKRFRNRTLGLEEDSRNTNEDGYLDVRPRPKRPERTLAPRTNAQESETPLMKRSKNDAKQWTWAIHREPARGKSSSVGHGYKWSEKRSEQSRRKVSRNGRRQPEESVLDHDL